MGSLQAQEYLFLILRRKNFEYLWLVKNVDLMLWFILVTYEGSKLFANKNIVDIQIL